MFLSWHIRRRPTLLWGAAMLLLLPVQASAQLQTTVVPTLPSLAEQDKDPHDPDATYCRPPQRQSDSRLLGPRVCMTNKRWDDLHAQGLDISADGKGTVASEKYRTLQTGGCRAQQVNCN
jgi:hypothetical protein